MRRKGTMVVARAQPVLCLAHFHAYYQNDVGIFSVDPVEMIAGALPRTQRRLVEAWAELHRAELKADWERLQEGQKPVPIMPLR